MEEGRITFESGLFGIRVLAHDSVSTLGITLTFTNFDRKEPPNTSN